MSKDKAHGKGQGMSIGKLNEYKRVMRDMHDVVIKHEWRPLRSWPATPHPQQERIDEFLSIPSRSPK